MSSHDTKTVKAEIKETPAGKCLSSECPECSREVNRFLRDHELDTKTAQVICPICTDVSKNIITKFVMNATL